MLKKMWYVYTVYEEKSFSKAAKRLFVSQPSLSAMVKKVESDYDITIFDRTTTPISLTPEGEYYISAAKKILRLDADMRQHFRECSKGLNGSVMFGGASFFCANMLSGIIRQFQSEYPDIHIGWQELRNDELASQILQKKIDFAFEVDKIETDGITSLKFGSEELILTVPTTFVTNAHLRSCCFRPGDMSNGVHSIYEAEPIDVGLFRDVPFVFLREGNDSYFPWDPDLQKCRFYAEHHHAGGFFHDHVSSRSRGQWRRLYPHFRPVARGIGQTVLFQDRRPAERAGHFPLLPCGRQVQGGGNAACVYPRHGRRRAENRIIYHTILAIRKYTFLSWTEKCVFSIIKLNKCLIRKK